MAGLAFVAVRVHSACIVPAALLGRRLLGSEPAGPAGKASGTAGRRRVDHRFEDPCLKIDNLAADSVGNSGKIVEFLRGRRYDFGWFEGR